METARNLNIRQGKDVKPRKEKRRNHKKKGDAIVHQALRSRIRMLENSLPPLKLVPKYALQTKESGSFRPRSDAESQLIRAGFGASRSLRSSDLPQWATEYDGPIVSSKMRRGVDCYEVVLTQTVVISSTVGGVINTVVGNSPASYFDWASFAAIFDEYRCLGLEVWTQPTERYNKTTSIMTGPIWVLVDYDDITALTSTNEAASYASSKEKSLDTPWKYSARMNGIENSGFVTTSSPVNTFAIKMYTDNVTISQEYMRATYKVLIQFRQRD